GSRLRRRPLAPRRDSAAALARGPPARRDARQAARRRSRRLPRPAPAGRRRLRHVVLTAAAHPQAVDEPGGDRLARATVLDDRPQAPLEDVAVVAVVALAQVEIDAGHLGLGE